MREFIYYSKQAVTSGKLIQSDLKAAGRMDIVCNVILSAFFISNKMRDDVKLHLLFDGPPNAPRHLILESNPEMPISKKDMAGLIKRMLYKSPRKKGYLKQIYPGCYIENKGFEDVVREIGKKVYVLDEKGEDIRQIKLDGVFVLGDQEGFPKDKKKFLKSYNKISVGPEIYFASQCLILLNNEIDRQVI
ncbi:MAG: tRNA (pseudouridine(54)-N(1))-methyltransferase TrmY [Candidatus Nanoarchaeia archaeon]